MSRLMRIVFFLVVVAAALFFVLRKPANKEVNVGDLAPEFVATDSNGKEIFVVKDENGKEVKLSDYRGNVVFLTFWFTDCTPCRQEMPDMELVNRVFKDRKFKMIPISTDANPEDVKRFYRDLKLTTMPMYFDPGKRIASRYNVYQFPETYLINGDGVVLKHYIGASAWSNASFMSKIEDLVKKQESPQSASQ